MSRVYINEVRKTNRVDFYEFVSHCDRIAAEDERAKTIDGRCGFRAAVASSVSFGNIVNSSKLPAADFCRIGPQNVDEAFAEEPSAKYRAPTRRGSSECQSAGSTETSMLCSAQDPRSPINLARLALQRRCELMVTGRRKQQLQPRMEFFEAVPDWEYFDRVAGLSCNVNRSLSFVALDTTLYHAFAERLGVDVLARKDQTVAIILDHEVSGSNTMYLVKIELAFFFNKFKI